MGAAGMGLCQHGLRDKGGQGKRPVQDGQRGKGEKNCPPAMMHAGGAIMARLGRRMFDRLALGIDIDRLPLAARTDDGLEKAIRGGGRKLGRKRRGEMKEDRQKGKELRRAEAPPIPKAI